MIYIDHLPLPIEDHSEDHLQEADGHFAGQPPSEEAAETRMDISTTSTHDIVPWLRVKADFWRGLTLDPFVLNSILGYRIEFIERPPLALPSGGGGLPRSRENMKALDEEVQSLHVKGAIETVLNPTLGFYSHLFLVPKKGGGATSSDKSKTLERLRRQEVIPYDYTERGVSSNKKGRLVDHDRSKGRLSTHTCTQGLQALLPLHMAREYLPVLRAPLRADVGAPE